MAPNKRRKLSHDSPQPAIDVSDVDWEPQFQVATRKKAPPQGGHQLYTSAYDPGLNLHYRVQLDGDGEAWSAIKQYKAFQTDGSSAHSQKIKPGDVVAVKGSEEPRKPRAERLDTDADANVSFTWWYAEVLEIRAEDPRHVYLRIVWLYKPDDLRGGRQKYHGIMEVIPSNDMQIINATTVDSLMILKKWNKLKQAELAMSEDKSDKVLLWRQTIDVSGGRQKLSPLEAYCVDDEAADPDDALVHCSNCHRWLHEECLHKQAVKDYKAGNLENVGVTEGKVPALFPPKADNIDPELQKDAFSSPSKHNRSLVSRFVDSVASPFRSHSQEPREADGAVTTGAEEKTEEEAACDARPNGADGTAPPQQRPVPDASEQPLMAKVQNQATGKLHPVKKKGEKAKAEDVVAVIRNAMLDSGKAVEIRQHAEDGELLKVARLRCLFPDCGKVID